MIDISKIVSGGQTGVDRASLDFSIKNQINCGGWCPQGRKAEDGILPELYPLSETNTDHYSERTEKNVNESDGTWILFTDDLDKGTRFTIDCLKKHNKPYLKINLKNPPETESVTLWINKHQVKKLNIAGPRESYSPGIYKRTLLFLEMIFKKRAYKAH